MPSVVDKQAKPDFKRAAQLDSASPSLRPEIMSRATQPMVLIAIFGAAGIALDRYMDPGVVWWLIPNLVAFLIWSGCYWRGLGRVGAVALLGVIIFTAAIWHHVYWNFYPANHIRTFSQAAPAPVCLRVEVRSEARHVATKESTELNPLPAKVRTRWLVEVLQIRDGHTWRDSAGRCDLVLHSDEWLPELRYGDQAIVFGSMSATTAATNPGQIDFGEYFRHQAKLVRLQAYGSSSIQVERPAVGWQRAGWLSRVRSQFDALIWRHVSPQRAGLASAILLGNRDQLTPRRRQQFLYSGTVHLLAISGLHVGILAGVFFLIFRLGCSNRKTALVATILFVISYAWLVEFRPPVTRAVTLICLLCLGRLMGKQAFSFNLLAVAAIIVLVVNPGELFQLGSQLSFLAVGTIILFKDWIIRPADQDPLNKLIRQSRPAVVRWLHRMIYYGRQAVMTSTLIWLMALPLVAAKFHLVSPIALLVNPILIVPMTIALYFGLGVLVFGAWFSWAADGCGAVCDRCLALIEWMVSSVQQAGVGYSWTEGPGATATGLFYGGVMLLVAFAPARRRLRWVAVWGIFWVAFAWLLPATFDRVKTAESQLAATFIDVGHGTSVLLELPDGRHVMYDAGTFGSPEFGVETVSRLLWHEKIEHLDAVVLSHADVDHFNALPQLAQRFSVGVVYVSPAMRRHNGQAVKTLFRAIEQQSIEIREIVWESKLQPSPEVVMSVLSPPPEGTDSTDNSDSIALLVEAFGRKLFLPGDLELRGMERLLSRPPIDCDIAMAPHHGSPRSSPIEFVKWCRPEHVVVSANPRKADEQVIRDVEQHGSLVLQTGRPGAVRYRITANGDLFAEVWQAGRWQLRNRPQPR